MDDTMSTNAEYWRRTTRTAVLTALFVAASVVGVLKYEHSYVQHVCQAGQLGDITVYRTHHFQSFTCPRGTYEIHP
jgi:hypothetical protein